MSLPRLLALSLLPAAAAAEVEQGPPNADFTPAFTEQTRAPALGSTPVQTEIFAEGLENPWGIALLPDGSYLVTERPGRLRLVSPQGAVSAPIAGVPEVDNRRQGGLLDVAVAEDFAETRRLWLSYAKLSEDGTGTTVATAVLGANGTALEEVRDIFVGAPGSRNPMHYGSRIVFEPGTDNIWITTGEHSGRRDRQLAQDLGTTYGKVIRIHRLTGAPAAGNPYIGAGGRDDIWSYGHRNMQGAAVHPDTGALWTIEHGPRGGDELNQPEPGLNYGWPVISYGINYGGSSVGSGAAVRDGMEQPVYYWDPVIAPGGMTFYTGGLFPDWQGDLLIGGLVAAGVVRLRLEDGLVVGEERIAEGIGRVRDVEQAPDGSLLILIDAPGGAIERILPGG